MEEKQYFSATTASVHFRLCTTLLDDQESTEFCCIGREEVDFSAAHCGYFIKHFIDKISHIHSGTRWFHGAALFSCMGYLRV